MAVQSIQDVQMQNTLRMTDFSFTSRFNKVPVSLKAALALSSCSSVSHHHGPCRRSWRVGLRRRQYVYIKWATRWKGWAGGGSSWVGSGWEPPGWASATEWKMTLMVPFCPGHLILTASWWINSQTQHPWIESWSPPLFRTVSLFAVWVHWQTLGSHLEESIFGNFLMIASFTEAAIPWLSVNEEREDYMF